MRAASLLVGIFAAGPVSAECQALDAVIANLAERYQELPVFIGTAAEGAWMITAAPDGSTFTLLWIDRAGRACPIGAGDAWSARTAGPRGEEG